MVQRSKRRERLFDTDRDVLLRALKPARDQCIEAQKHLKPFLSWYHSIAAITSAIDGFAYRSTDIPHYYSIGGSSSVAPGWESDQIAAQKKEGSKSQNGEPCG